MQLDVRSMELIGRRSPPEPSPTRWPAPGRFSADVYSPLLFLTRISLTDIVFLVAEMGRCISELTGLGSPPLRSSTLTADRCLQRKG